MIESLLDQTLQMVDLTKEEVSLGAVEQLLQALPEKALHLGIRVVLAAVFLLLGLQAVKLVRSLVRRSLERINADKGVAQFLDSLLKVGLSALLVLMIAISFGLDATSVMAMLGSVGVAFALALQGSLSNCAGGVLILLVKPFVVGDYIIEGSKGQEGTVLEIQLFYTKLQTADGRMITLPNGALANNPIVNYSTVAIRRLDLLVGISYEADLHLAKEILLSVLQAEALVQKELDQQVFVQELSDSAVLLNIRCWLKNEDYWEARARLLEQCKLELDAHGIEIPYPQLTVHGV